MILYLCEKPSQARDIGHVLGATLKREGFLEGHGVRVTWCIGHLLEMISPDSYKPEWKSWSLETLPILPNPWKLAVRRGASQQFKNIHTLLRRTSKVVLATDADREGETIGREVLLQCGYRGPIARLWLSALDETSIRKALNGLLPGEKTEPLYQAGLGRARADWLVGMNLSRAYTLLGRKRGYDGVLTVGRVQTPTLKLVVDRDLSIENFHPVTYFEVWVHLLVKQGGFQAKWIPNEAWADAEGRCLNLEKAKEVVSCVQDQTGIIDTAETKRIQEPPPLPLDLSTLQQEASRRWGMSAKKTLDTAQALYEIHKAITYPRSDCRYLPVSQFSESSAVLQALLRVDPSLAPLVHAANPTVRSRAWDDRKITAHHAIIPTHATPSLASISLDALRLYDCVRRHYLVQFFPAFEYDRSVIDAKICQEIFRAVGRVEKVVGWKQVLRDHEKERTKEDAPGEKEQTLPWVNPGDSLKVEQAKIEEKKTKPPQRYTEGTLIQAMKHVGKGVENPRLRQILRETSGIGTEATRASIIENLLKRKLLGMEGKKNLVSSSAARMLVDILPHSVTDPATTAVWEQALEDIAKGRGTLADFEEKAVTWVSRLMDNVKKRVAQEGGGVGEITPTLHRRSLSDQGGQTCPQCKTGRLVERTARQGRNVGKRFIGCNRFPECRYIAKESPVGSG